jgi:hypothetical protein
MSSPVVRIYRSEIDCIVNETAAHPDIETGGSIYGLWTDKGNATIVLAIGPGPAAKRSTTQFEQDLRTHQGVARTLLDTFGVQALGLWHSHHGLGLHELSGGDVRRTVRFAQRADQTKFCDLLTYFTRTLWHGERSSDVTVKPYVYVDAKTGRRAPTCFEVLPGVSPIRQALDRMAADKQIAPDIAETIRLPKNLSVKTRLEQSVELGLRDDDDAPQKSRSAVARVRDAVMPDSREEDQRPVPYGIPDLMAYTKHELEPLLKNVPPDLRIEVTPSDSGQTLRLTVTTPGHDVHEFDLGWDGVAAVVTSHKIRKTEATSTLEGLPQGTVLGLKDYFRRILGPPSADRRGR